MTMRLRTTLAMSSFLLLVGTGAFVVSADHGPSSGSSGSSALEAAPPTWPTDDRSWSGDVTVTTATSEATAPEPSDGQGRDPARPDVDAHEVLGAEPPAPPPPGPTDPIGEVDPGGLVPAGLDITAFPGPGTPQHPHHEPTVSGPDAFSAGPGCVYQCIASGIAYPRGFGAELVVQTKVPADLWLSVIADTDADGDWDVTEYETSPGKVTTHSWALDHLEPGQTHYVMVAATDEHNDTSHAWGVFTTLSTRDVEVAIHQVEITGGPTNVDGTHHRLRFEGGDFQNYNLGANWTYEDVDRHVDVELGVFRTWPGRICEGLWTSLLHTVYGDSDDSCASWNTASALSIDLDQVPVHDRWTSVGFTAVARSPEGVGASAPRWFDVAAYVSVHVTYR
jgi:hypothetical protein